MMMGFFFLFFLVPCVEAELCYNGGTFDGIKCICIEDLFYGPKCEFLVQESLNGSFTTSITSTSALSGEINTSPTHPAGTVQTLGSPTYSSPTFPNSTASTMFTTSPVDLLSPRTLPGQTQSFTTTLNMVISDGMVASAFTTSSWSGTQSPSSQGNTIMNEPSKTTPSTNTLATSSSRSSSSSRSTVSSRPIPGIFSSPMTSKSTTTIISTTFTTKKSSSPSTTKTTTAKSSIRTTTSELCYNGGTYDGIMCRCNEDLFYGPKCEFLKDEIPVNELSVTITVEAQVRITNREYKKSLEDLSSDYFQEIQAQFKKQMKDIYGAVPGYHDVKILRMRNGSIIVEHKVISQIQIKNNEEAIQQNLKEVIGAVNHSLADIHTDGECIDPSGPELCFVPLPNSTLIPSFSLKDTCKNISNPKYADYYYPHIMEGTIRCISRCFKGTQDSMNCYSGVCRLSETGPHCVCNNLDVFWYLDIYCQLPIQKSVLGLSLALALFFVIIIILVIFLVRAKQKKSKNSWSDDADYEKKGQRNPILLE